LPRPSAGWRPWRRPARSQLARRAARATSKLDAHEAFLRDLIERQADITLEEMRARLREERSLTVGLGTLWRFLDARDLTYKKRRPTRPSRTART
jgi:transposase